MADKDSDKERRKDLKELLFYLIKNFDSFASAIIVNGSLGYNWNYNILPGADLDLTFVGEKRNIESVICRGILEIDNPNEILEFYRSGEIDLINFKGVVKQLPVSICFFTISQLEKACMFNEFFMRSYRNVPKEGVTRFYNFNGDYITHKFENEKIGEGFKHKIFSGKIENDKYYTGILHGRFLHSPKIMLDKAGVAKKFLDNLWFNFLERMAYENPNFINLSKTNPLNALKNSKYFSEKLVRRIWDNTRDYLDKKGVSYVDR